MIVRYWSDFSCPFCYIAEARLKRVLKEMGAEDAARLDFRSFRLNPYAKQVPEHQIFLSYAKRMGEEGARMQIARIESMAAGEGLDFHYGTAWNSSTMDAHRLTKAAYAESRSLGDAVAEGLYKAFFSRNLVLADHGVLLAVAEAAGMDASRAAEILAGDEYRGDVLEDEAEAHGYGVQAVPFFVVNGRYGIPGCVDASDFRRILEAALRDEDAEDSTGMACGPDGCRRRPLRVFILRFDGGLHAEDNDRQGQRGLRGGRRYIGVRIHR